MAESLHFGTVLCTLTEPSDELEVTDLSLGPFTDSMIRVGGDYQAQIPEFKPGKLKGGVGGERGGLMQIEISGEKMVHVIKNIRSKLGSLAYLNLGSVTAAFTICLSYRKLKSQLLQLQGRKQQLKYCSKTGLIYFSCFAVGKQKFE